MATRRPKKEPKRQPEHDSGSIFNMNINGHMLSGYTVGDRWVWACPSWPTLAALHSGKADSTPMIEAFTGRALLATVTVEMGGDE